MRRAAGLLIVAAVTLPGAAAAQSEALLDCATLAVTPAFRDKLANAMLGKGNAEEDALIAQLVNVTDGCASRHKLSEEQSGAYFEYSIARLPRDALIPRLGNLGVSAQVIDDALDFGTGRSNPVISGDLSPQQLDTLVEALARAGVATDTLAKATWEMVGAYAAATSLMWQAQRRLQ